jgi:hypothetical protein
MHRLLPAIPILAWLAVPARADIAVLTNGQTFKVTAQRIEEGFVYLSLKDGGRSACPRPRCAVSSPTR